MTDMILHEIKISGTKENVKNFIKKHIKTNEDGSEPRFDFDTLIPGWEIGRGRGANDTNVTVFNNGTMAIITFSAEWTHTDDILREVINFHPEMRGIKCSWETRKE